MGKDHIHAIQSPVNGLNGEHFLSGKAKESKRPPTANFPQYTLMRLLPSLGLGRAGRRFPQ